MKQGQTRIYKLFGPAILMVVILGCQPLPPPPITVTLVDSMAPWKDLISATQDHPLPEGFTWANSTTPTKPNPRARSLNLAFTHVDTWKQEAHPLPGKTTEIQGRLLARRIMAVAAPYDASPISITLKEASALVLEPLDTIVPPRRAMAIDGILPGLPGYPLVQEIWLTATWDQGTQELALISAFNNWLLTLPITKPEAQVYTLGAVGDIVLEPPAQGVLRQANWDLGVLLKDTLPLLGSFDILMGNMEAPISKRGSKNPIKRFTFRHPPEVLPALKKVGFDYLTFANNHTLDYGDLAFLDTLDNLEASGIAWSGAGPTEAQAAEPALLSLGDQTLAIFGFASYPTESRGYKPSHAAAGPQSPGILTNLDLLLVTIAEAKARGNLVIVWPHAGFEYRTKPAPEIQTMYRSMIRAGADLVLGSHPHVLQGIEAYQGSIILYSLGNFLFTNLDEPPVAQSSGIFTFILHEGTIRGYSMTPVLATNDYTTLDPNPGPALERYRSLMDLVPRDVGSAVGSAVGSE